MWLKPGFPSVYMLGINLMLEIKPPLVACWGGDSIPSTKCIPNLLETGLNYERFKPNASV